LATLVVGGSGKDVGKTGLVCAIISALPEFAWTAVKITGHDYEPARKNNDLAGDSIREETCAGQHTDTARYLAAGARRALLVTRLGSDVPIETILHAIGTDRNVIFESNRIVDVLKPDVCLALISARDRKPSFDRLLRIADAILTLEESTPEEFSSRIPRFELTSPERLPADFELWLRDRLSLAV
jgi:molybdopterin-guanine dinucleotide biosynthesis protein